MSESSDRRILGWSLVALIVVSVLVTATVILNLNYIRSTTTMRGHAFQTLDTARDLRRLIEAEDLARGQRQVAAPTPAPADGEALGRAERATDAGLNRLMAMVRDNPDQQRRLRDLRDRLDLARARGGDNGTRAGYEAFRAEELRLLARRSAATEDAFRLSYLILIGGALAGCVASMLIFWRGAQVLLRAKRDADKAAELGGQLLQFSRLDALGEMAGTLAHELNQPLTAATTYINAAKRAQARAGPQGAQTAEILTKAGEQVKRAGDIIRRMRDFLERGESQQQPENLAEMIEEARTFMLMEAARHGATIRVSADPAASWAMADRIQIQQVLVNLMRNALEAMADQPRRELEVTVLSREDSAQVTVADTGPGVSPEIAAQLFRPFVTSKAGGMGVGLSMCRSIVEGHGGRIWADGDGEGAAFHFTLSRAQPSANQKQADVAA